jgi:hypothetical protein
VNDFIELNGYLSMGALWLERATNYNNNRFGVFIQFYQLKYKSR